MEKMRVTKVAPTPVRMLKEAHILEVEKVKMRRKGDQVTGTLHLMPHHLVFSFLPEQKPDADPSTKLRQKEVWSRTP
jgi:myotubularin-related protein 6/7/8